ncbi:MAG TPA: hypothetical protein DEP72_05985 [Clostridiales bacterium]|nr:MAG: hypothetical protein A2Y18_01400 [Clostridiales bacterium GWD2_32_19]HCC07688.1 hypothetical protein [Clostridiales bacterium]
MYIMSEKRTDNNMNTTELEFINIYGLFGRYDIKIPFDKEVNIFIGENGLGKTTVLNCIYYILEKKFTKLETVNFLEIHIKFRNESKVHEISTYDVASYNLKRSGYHGVYMDYTYLEHLLNDFNFKITDAGISEEEIEYLVRKIARQTDMPISVARRQIINYIRNNEFPNRKEAKKGDNKKIDNLISSISKNIQQRIIYLPTYRRIEDDFNKLNIKSDEFNKAELLIRFGMSDVQNSIEKILGEIRIEAMKGFNEMTGVLLKQYADGGNIISTTDILLSSVDIETVKIVLNRVGNEIEEAYKEKILKLIEKREIYNNDYLYLLNLIGKLISNYDLQKKYDDRIKKFTETCNKYLNNKKFYYNQSTLTLEVYLDDIYQEEVTIKLTQLSSGEKQIVSLFSKLYLESDEKSIIIIDEPELSLSLNWQKMLLPDIMRTNNCKLLITVTHSPFIFENEFDFDAKEMRKYIRMHN